MAKQILIIIPGWGGSQSTWQSFMDQVRDDFAEVICLELPCFGAQPCPSEVWGVDEYAAFVDKQLPTDTSSVLLLAHSFGGQVTTALLSGVGKKRTFARVVLTGPAIIRPKNIVRRLIWGAVAKIGKLCLSVIPHAGLKQRARRILYRVADSPDGAGERDTIKHNIYQKIIRQDMTDRLAEIDHPITLLHGTNDRYVPVRHSKKVSELLKHGTLHIIPNGTHGLHRSVPDALRTELISS